MGTRHTRDVHAYTEKNTHKTKKKRMKLHFYIDEFFYPIKTSFGIGLHRFYFLTKLNLGYLLDLFSEGFNIYKSET